MYKIFFLSVFFPSFAFAQVSGVDDLINLVTDFISALIPFFLSLAVLVFFWGIVKFIAHTDDEKAREEGKRVMIWGMVAIFVMVGLWSIVGYLQESLGLDVPSSISSAPDIPTALPAS